MKIHLPKNNLAVILIVTILAVGIATVAVLSVDKYVDKRNERRASMAQQEKTIKEQDRAKSLEDSKKQAILNRLVKICLAYQKDYDLSSVKSRGTATRPDCTTTLQ